MCGKVFNALTIDGWPMGLFAELGTALCMRKAQMGPEKNARGAARPAATAAATDDFVIFAQFRCRECGNQDGIDTGRSSSNSGSKSSKGILAISFQQKQFTHGSSVEICARPMWTGQKHSSWWWVKARPVIH